MKNVKILGNAQVYDNAKLEGKNKDYNIKDAKVSGNAKVSGYAELKGEYPCL